MPVQHGSGLRSKPATPLAGAQLQDTAGSFATADALAQIATVQKHRGCQRPDRATALHPQRSAIAAQPLTAACEPHQVRGCALPHTASPALCEPVRLPVVFVATLPESAPRWGRSRRIGSTNFEHLPTRRALPGRTRIQPSRTCIHRPQTAFGLANLSSSGFGRQPESKP